MKRTFLKVLPFAAALLLATSCSKDDNNSTDEIVNGGEKIETVTKTVKTITIKGKVKQSISKVTTNSDETALAFEENDVFTFGKEGDAVYGTITIQDAIGNYTATVNYTDDEALFSTTGFTATHGANPSKISEGYSTLAEAVQHAYYVIPFKVVSNGEGSYLLRSRSLSKAEAESDILVYLQSAFIKALSAETTTLGGTPITVEADKYYVVPVGKAMGTSGNNTLAGKIYNLGTKVFAFSVSATKKVAFSSGNLLKNSSTNEYKFAANQWTLTEDGYTNTFTYNDIDNWNNKTIDGNQWYALSDVEWEYLIGDGSSKRENATTLRKWRSVNNVNGLVILPDECTASIDADWATLEAAGAVFLPCGTNYYGEYWSSSPDGSDDAYFLYFNSGGFVDVCYDDRGTRLAVRLVRSL